MAVARDTIVDLTNRVASGTERSTKAAILAYVSPRFLSFASAPARLSYAAASLASASRRNLSILEVTSSLILCSSRVASKYKIRSCS